MKKNIPFAACLSLAAALWSFDGHAQNNQPFSFGSVTGGSVTGAPTSSGMSFAGRQAILNEKIFGSTPRNLVIGPSGALLDVSEGPGGIAVVSEQSSPVIPQFRASFSGIGLGGFGGGGSSRAFGGTTLSSSTFTTHAISSWIGFVQGRSSIPASVSTRETIDAWTAQVF
jgi:hypothetical protein